MHIGSAYGNSSNDQNWISQTNQLYRFPGQLEKGEKAVVTVLVDSMGQEMEYDRAFQHLASSAKADQKLTGYTDGIRTPRGILGYDLVNGSFSHWRVQGKRGGNKQCTSSPALSCAFADQRTATPIEFEASSAKAGCMAKEQAGICPASTIRHGRLARLPTVSRQRASASSGPPSSSISRADWTCRSPYASRKKWRCIERRCAPSATLERQVRAAHRSSSMGGTWASASAI